MENTKITTSHVLSALIESWKEYKSTLELAGRSLKSNELEAFRGSLDSFYNCIIGRISNNGNSVGFYLEEEFSEMFFNAVTNNEELPVDVCEWAGK